MFIKTISKIGSTEVVSIHNEDNSFGMEIIPSAGALVRSLTIQGKNIIDGVKNEIEVKKNDAYKSTFLAPFPNRIKNGVYSFNEKTYQLPVNEKALNNALHGLIYKAPFRIIRENFHDYSFEIDLEHKYSGNNEGFPFPFTTLIKIQLDKAKGLTIQLTFTNNSNQSIPFGFGWHPYFQLVGKTESWKLQTPLIKQFEVDQQMIPTGKSNEVHDFTALKSLKNVTLDDCFEIVNKGNVCETRLESDQGFGIKLWQETGEKKLNFLQIYTPPHGKAIAIEPQTCCIDAFNNSFGLFYLAENETIKASFGIEFYLTN